MTQEKKQLLLIDISARLPYGVLCDFVYNIGHPQKLLSVSLDEKYQIHLDSDEYVFGSGKSYSPSETIVDNIKPYLRPLSSMTEEEEKEFNHVFELELAALEEPAVGHTIKSAASNAFVIDFYNRHHFDFRGLIPMGLAFEAKEGMYKF